MKKAALVRNALERELFKGLCEACHPRARSAVMANGVIRANEWNSHYLSDNPRKDYPNIISQWRRPSGVQHISESIDADDCRSLSLRKHCCVTRRGPHVCGLYIAISEMHRKYEEIRGAYFRVISLLKMYLLWLPVLSFHYILYFCLFLFFFPFPPMLVYLFFL